MKPQFFDRKLVSPSEMYEGQVSVQRLVTREKSNSQYIGLHISQGKPNVSGKGDVNRTLDEVIFVLQGSIALDCGEGMHFLTPDQGVLIPAGTTYDWAAGPDGWTAVIVFSPPKV